MFFTEDPEVPFTIDADHIHEVVRASSTLHVERNLTLAVLALHAGAAVLLPADDALEQETLGVDLAAPHWRLGSNSRTWYPHGAAMVNPFIQSFRVGNCLKSLHNFLLIPLNEEGVVLRYFHNLLRRDEVELDLLLR